MKGLSCFMVIALLSIVPNGARAELIDRGGGLIYDTEFNITWLRDANYARTSGYHKDGRMTWDEAMKFVADLKYYDPVRKITWDDWRLPTARNRDGSGPDRGYYTRGSELGHMFYTNLKNPGMYKETKLPSSQANVPMNKRVRKELQAGFGLKNTGPFINLTQGEYWAGTEDTLYLNPKDPLERRNAWDFFMESGAQFFCDKWDHWYFAWPVRDGDVGPPPDEREKK
jgi:hypothetical protein